MNVATYMPMPEALEDDSVGLFAGQVAQRLCEENGMDVYTPFEYQVLDRPTVRVDGEDLELPFEGDTPDVILFVRVDSRFGAPDITRR